MKKFTFFALIICSLFFFILTPLRAATTMSALQAGPILKSAKNIALTGEIDGDVYLLGGQVTVDAQINGDLIVLAGQVEIKGTVRDDLRVIAGQADVYSSIGDDLVIIAGQTNVYSSAHTSNTAILLASQTRFSGQVDQQASIYSNSLELTKEAIFNDDLKITYYQDPQISTQSTVSGALKKEHSDKLNYQTYLDKLSANQSKTVSKITFLVVLQKLTILTLEIFIGWLLISLLPQITVDLSQLSLRQPGSSIGWGLVAFTTIPLVGFLLILTLVGIPLGVLTFVIFVASAYLAKLIGALSLGQQLSKKPTQVHKNFIIGIIILSILKLIPVLGWLAYSIIFLNGLGSLSLLIFKSLPQKKS